MMHQSFLREQDEVATTATPSFYPMEGWEFACLPCDSHSVDDSNAGCDSLGFDTEHYSDIDASFQSRSSTSPMAMAMSMALSRNHQQAAQELDAASNSSISMSMSKSMKKKQRQRRRQQQQQRAGRQVLFPPQHSQSGEKLLLLPCRFFQTKKGCRKGISCPFDHSIAAAF